jgi:ribosomal protein L32E
MRRQGIRFGKVEKTVKKEQQRFFRQKKMQEKRLERRTPWKFRKGTMLMEHGEGVLNRYAVHIPYRSHIIVRMCSDADTLKPTVKNTPNFIPNLKSYHEKVYPVQNTFFFSANTCHYS